MSERDTDPTVQRLREEISGVDRAILDAVNARIELVARIRSHKAEVGLPFVDADRERALIEALDAANSVRSRRMRFASCTASCSTSRNTRSAAALPRARSSSPATATALRTP